MTGEELKALRCAAGLTRRALALPLDCTENAIYQWETGGNKIKKIYEIALLKIINSYSKKEA